MWITRREINIAKRENDQMRRYWRENGAERPPTHVSFVAGGDPIGAWVYGHAHYNGLSSEQGDATLKARRKAISDRKMSGRLTVKQWNSMATR